MDLQLPQQSLVNKFIPKSKFFHNSLVNTRLKKEFTSKIQRITWQHKLSEETIGISKTPEIEEIQIFQIDLKEQIIPTKILHVIDRMILYPILYVFRHNNNHAYGITLTTDGKRHYYFSDWGQDISFDFDASDLGLVHENIIKQLVTRVNVQDRDFDDIVKQDLQLKTLEKEIVLLKNKIKKQKQFNKKVELNKELLALEREHQQCQ